MPRAPRPPRIHPDPHADRITQEIDAISWDEWLAEDARTAVFGYDSDGCQVRTWDLATSSFRSVILHDGCEHGYGAHGFSGSLVAEWGREHGSRLQFAAFVLGVSERSLAKRFGIDLGRNPLQGLTLEDLGIKTPTSDGTDAEDVADAKVAAASTAVSNGVWLEKEIARIEEETGVWESIPFLLAVDDAAASHGLLNWGVAGRVLAASRVLDPAACSAGGRVRAGGRPEQRSRRIPVHDPARCTGSWKVRSDQNRLGSDPAAAACKDYGEWHRRRGDENVRAHGGEHGGGGGGRQRCR
jgi:hypothetical protein